MSRRSRHFSAAAAALDDAPPQLRRGEATSGPGAAEGADSSEVNRAHVWGTLHGVIDPEIGLDIVTLGLVYSLAIDGGSVRVTFTLTTPGCPMEEAITGGVVHAVSAVVGVEQVLPDLVWEPRWHPGMIQEGAL